MDTHGLMIYVIIGNASTLLLECVLTSDCRTKYIHNNAHNFKFNEIFFFKII